MSDRRAGVWSGPGSLGQGHLLGPLRSRFVVPHGSRLRCVRVFDPAQARAAQAAQLTGAKTAQTAEEVFSDPGVDIVAVLTPVFTHAELVEKGVKEGAKITADGIFLEELERELICAQATLIHIECRLGKR